MSLMHKEKLYEMMNDGVLEERYNSFQLNLKKNRPLIDRYGGLKRVIPFFEKKNVVIAGAGASLNRQTDILKKYFTRPDVLLVSVDMALRPLIKQGIVPDYVLSCETTPAPFFRGIDTEKIHLLAFSCMSNVNLKSWKGDISFYNWMIDSAEYNILWSEAGLDLGSVATGNIVTTQAVSLALGCNVNSLVLVGNDLGFGSEYYALESLVHQRHLRVSDRVNTFPSLEIALVRKRREYQIKRGERFFYTDNQFLTAKYWLEELLLKHRVKVYDSSEPGCSETSVVKTDLEDYFKTVLRKKQRGRRRS